MGSPPFRFGSSIPALLVAFLFAGFVAAPATGSEPAPAGLLDGKAFVVEKGRKGGAADGKDTYLFRNGTFRSAAYEKGYGFAGGPYAATQRGDAVAFEAEMESGSHGRIRWEGTVAGDRIDARYTWSGRKSKWYRPSPEKTEHWARSVSEWPTEDPGPPEGAPPSNLLDGSAFLVQSGEQGKEASHHNDYLVFRAGRFVSSDCVEELDFRESAYSASPGEDGIRFRARSTSPGHGTMIWDGIVRGNVVDATARWVHKRWYWTVDRIYWFKGRLLE